MRRIDKRRLRGQNLGLRLLQLRLVLVLLDREQQIALFDEGAVMEMLLLEIALDARDQLDRLTGRGVAGQLDIVGDGLRLAACTTGTVGGSLDELRVAPR